MTSLDETMKLLGDKTRLRILLLLFKNDLCVCQLVGILEEPQGKISRHLGKLRDSGAVVFEREERFIRYRLNRENIFLVEILGIVDKHLEDDSVLKQDRIQTKKKDLILKQCGAVVDL